jgi:hypothetical protein
LQERNLFRICIQLAKIVVEPDPIDAEPGDDYGYDITIEEWPDIDLPNLPTPEETFTTDSTTVQTDSTNITADKE